MAKMIRRSVWSIYLSKALYYKGMLCRHFVKSFINIHNDEINTGILIFIIQYSFHVILLWPYCSVQLLWEDVMQVQTVVILKICRERALFLLHKKKIAIIATITQDICYCEVGHCGEQDITILTFRKHQKATIVIHCFQFSLIQLRT